MTVRSYIVAAQLHRYFGHGRDSSTSNLACAGSAEPNADTITLSCGPGVADAHAEHDRFVRWIARALESEGVIHDHRRNGIGERRDGTSSRGTVKAKSSM